MINKIAIISKSKFYIKDINKFANKKTNYTIFIAKNDICLDNIKRLF